MPAARSAAPCRWSCPLCLSCFARSSSRRPWRHLGRPLSSSASFTFLRIDRAGRAPSGAASAGRSPAHTHSPCRASSAVWHFAGLGRMRCRDHTLLDAGRNPTCPPTFAGRCPTRARLCLPPILLVCPCRSRISRFASTAHFAGRRSRLSHARAPPLQLICRPTASAALLHALRRAAQQTRGRARRLSRTRLFC